MKTWWWVLALGVIAGLLSAGLILLVSQPPRGNPITLLPPPTPVPIQVQVSGEVHAPGVYALPPGSRLQEAIAAAGGFTAEANSAALNLASPLEDGFWVQVPSQIKTETPFPTAAGSSGARSSAGEQPSPTTAESTSSLIDINTATQEELESLPGIGPVTAQKIIAFREENGPFTSIEEIQKVSGIGPATFEKIRELITVGEQP